MITLGRISLVLCAFAAMWAGVEMLIAAEGRSFLHESGGILSFLGGFANLYLSVSLFGEAGGATTRKVRWR